MRKALVFPILLCLLISGCTSGDKAKILNVTLEKSPSRQNAYRGQVIGQVLADDSYKMCSVILSQGEYDVGKFDKVTSAGFNSTVTVNIDGDLEAKPDSLMFCCYVAQSYSASKACSKPYPLNP